MIICEIKNCEGFKEKRPHPLSPYPSCIELGIQTNEVKVDRVTSLWAEIPLVSATLHLVVLAKPGWLWFTNPWKEAAQNPQKQTNLKKQKSFKGAMIKQ